AIQRRRVRLYGGFARPKVEGAAQGRRERRDLGRLEEARRPAAEVQGVHPRMTERLALARDLLSKCGEVLTPELAQRRCCGVVAVGATRSTERDVHIEAEGRGPPRAPARRRGPRPMRLGIPPR